MENPDRNRRKAAPLAVLAIVAIGVGLIGYLQADPAPDHERIYIRNGGGAVLFTHAAHAEQADGCVRCHHELAGAVANDCSDCHDEGYEAGMLAHDELVSIEAHACDACHEVAAEAEAGNCRGCHPAVATEGDAVVSCTECHDEGYEPGLLAHAELLEIEAHTCDACHHPRTVAEAYHQQCTDCHLEHQPERFAAADGRARCEACHLE